MNILVFSHLRWNFVYQRPQHLLSRFAQRQRVIFWEEPEFRHINEPSLRITQGENLLTVVVPELPTGLTEQQCWDLQRELLTEFLTENAIKSYIAWYYTPMARHFTRDLSPAAVVYDCMDELSAFRGAPPGLTQAEAEIFRVADLIFTGGRSLYEYKKLRHPSVHLFPSSIDAQHFQAARTIKTDSVDQQEIPRPRFGYCGVIDERMDLELLAGVAQQRPEWHLVMVGPVVKIQESELPRAGNIHYLGARNYRELPQYMSGWDVGILPFARNESTRFISPTKTPEYLAAGLPVISTSITDVVRPYAESGLVTVADSPAEFIAAAEKILRRDPSREKERLHRVDAFLSQSSWDRTFEEMRRLILKAISTTNVRSHGVDIENSGSSAIADSPLKG